jgi:hypothetical protein
MGPKLNILPGNEKFILLAVIILIYLAVRIGPLLFSRNKPGKSLPLGTPRTYGLMGGTICPHCQRPYPFTLLALRFGFGTRLARCQFCGHWNIVRWRSLEEMRAAEAAELSTAQPGHVPLGKSEQEKARDLLDESRFTDKP